jgi:hypothetical protein
MSNAQDYLNKMIEKLAYDRWEKRGRPSGSGREDWLAAEKELRHHFSIDDKVPETYLADAPEPDELPLF